MYVHNALPALVPALLSLSCLLLSCMSVLPPLPPHLPTGFFFSLFFLLSFLFHCGGRLAKRTIAALGYGSLGGT